ncbi:MAG: enoyl-CoA hydratase-related protein [Steroidobacteraceae bacterium]
MAEAVLYDIKESVATVTLNRPDALNAFDDSLRIGLLEALQKAVADSSVRAVVLTGAGRAFSAGADLRSTSSGENLGVKVGRQLREQYNPSVLTIAQMPKPVVAAVHGFATGIALGYVLACDVVVMGRTAFFQVPFARLGLVPDGGVTWQMTQALGARVAFEVALSGDKIPAERCLQLGLANRLVDDDQVLASATEWAQRLAQAAPISLAGLKRNVRRATTVDLATTLADETEAQVRCLDSTDFREGVTAFFEKRSPRFRGH